MAVYLAKLRELRLDSVNSDMPQILPDADVLAAQGLEDGNLLPSKADPQSECSRRRLAL
jgi:hypothetical protein